MTAAAKRALGWLEELPANAWFAYGSILALCVRVLWTVGNRDLTYGDTSYYFKDATRFARLGDVDAAWSPLYSVLYGAATRVLGDPFAATVSTRVLFVSASTLVVLAIGRRVLRPWSAWVAAAWWVQLEIVHDALYEVHIVAAVGPLVAVLVVVSGRPSRLRRGVTLAVLAVSVVVLRNEFASAFLVIAAACAVTEIRRQPRPRLGELLAYAAPLGVAALAVAGTISLDPGGLQGVRAGLEAKQRLNVCQLYATSVVQMEALPNERLLDCGSLLRRDFERADVSLLEAVRANPTAMAEYAAWNIRLLPAGLELALFDAHAHDVEPDVRPTEGHSLRAGILTLAALGVATAALVLHRRELRERVRRHRFAGVVVASIGVAGLLVAAVSRPRPSSLFPLSALLVIGITGAIALVLRRLGIERSIAAGVPIAAALMLVFVGPTWDEGPQPLLDAYRRVAPHAPVLDANAVFVAATYSQEVCNYVVPLSPCTGREWSGLAAEVAAGADLASLLEEAGASMVYADATVLASPAGPALEALARPGSGWRVLARSGAGAEWVLLAR